ncbi:MAG: phospholipid carrier-dependent glycosyltransferase [Candidatus Peribacteraceae bacterium]|nr:phospholipid carrier-dependent glycosyltransferase [Candidatus Peribacteraceae bacterium]
MKSLPLPRVLRSPAVLLGLFIFVLSFLTYFQNYTYPPALFWDENYHIASAQKYLNGVYFMEPHPPLGKLLIALGEQLLHPNNQPTDSFLVTDYARELPAGFSFAGYRLFPTLFGWLAAPLLYLILLLLLRNPPSAAVFSFLYVFDNALIVHTRGAMLDSTLIFFCLLAILAFLLQIAWRNDRKKFLLASALFGAAFGAAATTKETGMILLLLPCFLGWKLWPDRDAIGRGLLTALVAFAVVFVSVWYTHFALGSRIQPSLPDQGFYQASDAYKNILINGQNRSPAAFPVMLRDSFKFMGHYARGVPRLDLCKNDENGSPFFLWPLGARSISYRWETPDGSAYRYLYLQANPVVWWMSFGGVLLGIALLLASLVVPFRKPLTDRFLLTVFVTLYVCYMAAISQLGRVMYLYHYFPPLLFGFIILALVTRELKQLGPVQLTEQRRKISLLVFGFLIFATFQFYRPFTYYQPLTDAQFARRNIFPMWGLTCVHCERVNGMAIPCK